MPETAPQPSPEQPKARAAEHVADAHKLLTRLRASLGNHPELEEAIENLEQALNALAVKTGGLL